MAMEQEHLLEQLSRDKLFSIYQFLLLESRSLQELSRSSSKSEMVSALSQILSPEDVQYCVDFFENYEFYDVPSMKWAMLDALPDELLATLHTIYLDDVAVAEEHRELVDRLGQSPYFLKEDARKFYLWYNYFRKRLSLEQLAQTSGHFGISVNPTMQTQRVDLQANRNAPLFSMATHGDILGLSLDSAETREVYSPARLHTPPTSAEYSAPSQAPEPQMSPPAPRHEPRVWSQTDSISDSIAAPHSIQDKDEIVNQTMEITALDLESYLNEQSQKSEPHSRRRDEPTRIDHAFARVVEEIKKRQNAPPNTPNPEPAPHLPHPAAAARRGLESHPTIIINTMELNAALEQIESLEAQEPKDSIITTHATPQPMPTNNLSPQLLDTIEGSEPEPELVELEPLEESLDEPLEESLDEPLDEEDSAHLLDESALIEDSGMDNDEHGSSPLISSLFFETKETDTTESLLSASTVHSKSTDIASEPPNDSIPPQNNDKNNGKSNGKINETSSSEVASASSLPSFSAPTWGAMMMTRNQLDVLTFLLYRISLVGAPYGRIQIRAIRLYMQRILGCDPAQLRWIRDKLKELQTQELPLVPPPLTGLASLLPLLSYGMRLHFLHTSIFLLGVKSLSTLERQHEFLHTLAVELGIAPEDVSFFDLFNIGREEIQLGMQDCLELFGLESGAKEEDIRKAHRDLAKRFHPDKFHSLGPEFLRLAERKMKEANMALEILLYRADRNV